MTLVALVPCLTHDLRSAAVFEGGEAGALWGAVATAGAAGADAAALAYDCFADVAFRAGWGLGTQGGGRVGERGGLGGGDEGGLVSKSAGCTATESMGTECAGGEPERWPDEVSGTGWAEELTNDASLAAKSRKRDVAASSRARKSSWSLARRASFFFFFLF